MAHKAPLQFKKKPAAGPGKVGAAQVFARPALPQRPVAPEAAGPDKDAAQKKKVGAADIFGRR